MLGRRNLGLLAVCLGSALAFGTATACSGSSTSSAASGGTGGSATGGTGGTPGSPDQTCKDTGVTCATFPADPGQPAAAGTTPTVLAISQLFLGDTDRQGNPSPTAWKDYGYDLDGIVSTKTGTNHCAPVKGANPANVKTDGTNGIDNSFGSNLMPLIVSLASDPGSSVNP